MEYVFSGFIEYSFTVDRDFANLKLRGVDGYRTNLVYRFEELKDSFNNNVSVSYFITDKECSKEEAMTGFLNKLEGVIESGNHAEEYYYSEYTNGFDYTTTLTVGGHSLYDELRKKVGRFCILTVEVLEEN